MKKLLLLIAALSGASNLFAQSEHVVLVSIDGLRPEFYLEDKWPTPHIKTAMKEGAYANGVTGVFPSVTYPSHTSIITGVSPAKHGIYYNTPPEPQGITGKWNWFYDSIKTPTIFTGAKAKGLKTASIFWPVSLGSIADYNVPEFWYLPKTKGGSRDMLNALKEHAQPKLYMEELQTKAIGNLEEIDFNGDYYSIDAINARIAAYTLRTHKPSFLSLHLVALDHFEHEQGRDGDKVKGALAVADNAIMELMEAAKKAGILEKTTFIITGDHGFVDIHTSIHPNVFLAQAGLFNIEKPELSKAYFHSAGASSFLLLKDKKDKATLKKVEGILSQLPVELRSGFIVKSRTDLDEVGASLEAALALAPMKGFTFGNNRTGTFTTKVKGGTHGYFPDFKEIETGFVSFGAGINKGVVVEKMSLKDIAPIVNGLLKLDLTNMEGSVPIHILKK